MDVSEGIDISKTSASKKCMFCHYWYFKDAGFKFESYVCNKCHDVLMTAYELKNIAILSVRGVDFRCILWDISKNKAINRLNNSCKMEFGTNKTPVEVIKGEFRGTFFRDIYSGVTRK